MIKRIDEVFTDRNKKTFNIRYKKDGKEMESKIENSVRLNDANDYISSYNIIVPKARE